MPVKIYWGPPGSYKTSSAIWDEVSVCAKEGRYLITNIRGLTEERVRANMPDGAVADSFRCLNLPQGDPASTEKLRRWWHWAPFGAYIVLDEVQAVYPPQWSKGDLRVLDMTEPRAWPSGEPMPKEVELIFDMHRHGNWDMAFCTPAIKKVRPEIRAAAEVAFKHKNLAMLGIRGRFMQSMHLAEDSGSASDMYLTRMRKVPPYVFKLYDSTATGKTTDSRAGLSLLKNPRVLFLAAVLLACVVAIVTRPAPSFIRNSSVPAQASGAPTSADSAVRSPAQGVQHRGQAAPALISAPAPAVPAPQPAGPAYSAIWRVLGYVRVDETKVATVVLEGKGGRRLISAALCSLPPSVLEPRCLVDGEVITPWTGDPVWRAAQEGRGA